MHALVLPCLPSSIINPVIKTVETESDDRKVHESDSEDTKKEKLIQQYTATRHSIEPIVTQLRQLLDFTASVRTALGNPASSLPSLSARRSPHSLPSLRAGARHLLATLVPFSGFWPPAPHFCFPRPISVS
jgi:hypothetical protein